MFADTHIQPSEMYVCEMGKYMNGCRPTYQTPSHDIWKIRDHRPIHADIKHRVDICEMFADQHTPRVECVIALRSTH